MFKVRYHSFRVCWILRISSRISTYQYTYQP
nr:MAG TPA: hypothetical protein [Bacteriophage sp.]